MQLDIKQCELASWEYGGTLIKSQQRTLRKRGVGGSNPSIGTIFSDRTRHAISKSDATTVASPFVAASRCGKCSFTSPPLGI